MAITLPDPLKNKEPVITAAELSFEVITFEPEYGNPTPVPPPELSTDVILLCNEWLTVLNELDIDVAVNDLINTAFVPSDSDIDVGVKGDSVKNELVIPLNAPEIAVGVKGDSVKNELVTPLNAPEIAVGVNGDSVKTLAPLIFKLLPDINTDPVN